MNLLLKEDVEGLGFCGDDEMLETFAVFATPDKLAAVLRERYSGISGRIALYDPIPGSDPEAPWRAFVKAFKQAA